MVADLVSVIRDVITITVDTSATQSSALTRHVITAVISRRRIATRSRRRRDDTMGSGKLRDVDVTGVEPLISPLQVMPHMNADGEVVNGGVMCPLRDDDVVESGGAEMILSHAKYKYRKSFYCTKSH